MFYSPEERGEGDKGKRGRRKRDERWRVGEREIRG